MKPIRLVMTGSAFVVGWVLSRWLGAQALEVAAGFAMCGWVLSFLVRRPFAAPEDEGHDTGDRPGASVAKATHSTAVRLPASVPERPDRPSGTRQTQAFLGRACSSGVIDRPTFERLTALLEVEASAVLPAKAPTVTSSVTLPGTVEARAPQRLEPEPVAEPLGPTSLERLREAVTSDLAVHGLAYLGVLFVFAGSLGFMLFSFGSVQQPLRPLAEIAMPALLLGSAWFLRRRGAPFVATTLGVVGGLLLPAMAFASFVDGVAFPFELQGMALIVAIVMTASMLAIAYALYARAHPEASTRYLVAPMIWVGAWALGFIPQADDGFELNRWSAAQAAAVLVATALTTGLSRRRPASLLGAAALVAAVPGLCVAYVTLLVLGAAEAWPELQVLVGTVATITTLELLDPGKRGEARARPRTSVGLAQAGVLTVALLAVGVGAEPVVSRERVALTGLAATVAFLGLLEWQRWRARADLVQRVCAVGALAGAIAAMIQPLPWIVAWSAVTVWSHVRRRHRSPAFPAEFEVVVAAVAPAVATAGAIVAWPDGAGAAAAASILLVSSIGVRLAAAADAFYRWWIPSAAAGLVAVALAPMISDVPTPEPGWGAVIASCAGGAALVSTGHAWARVWLGAAAFGLSGRLSLEWFSAPRETWGLAWGTLACVAIFAAFVPRSLASGHLRSLAPVAAGAALLTTGSGWPQVASLSIWCAAWAENVRAGIVGSPGLMSALVGVLLRLRGPPSARGARSAILEARTLAGIATVASLSLSFLVVQGLAIAEVTAGHRAWNGPALAATAMTVGALARTVPRGVVSRAVVGCALMIAASGIAVAAPAVGPSIVAIASIIALAWIVGPELRGALVTWVAWAATVPLALLLAARAGVEDLGLATVLLAWGGILFVGGLVWDDLAGGRRHPGNGLRVRWVWPPVAIGALIVPIAVALRMSSDALGWGKWALVAAAIYLAAAVLLYAGSPSIATWGFGIAGLASQLELPVFDRPLLLVAGAGVAIVCSLPLARVPSSHDPWTRWDLAPLIVGHVLIGLALVRTAEIGPFDLTWVASGGLLIALGWVRRKGAWVASGAVIAIAGAWVAGPGSSALVLAACAVGAVLAAARSAGPVRRSLQSFAVVAAAMSWSQGIVWLGLPTERVWLATAAVAGMALVAAAGAVRRRMWAREWSACLAALGALGVAVAVVGSAVTSEVMPEGTVPLGQVAWAIALGLGSVSVASAVAAAPLGLGELRFVSVASGESAILSVLLGARLDPAPALAVFVAIGVVTTVAGLLRWRARPGSPWLGPLAAAAATADVIAMGYAAAAFPRRDLLEAVLLLTGLEAAAVGVVVRRAVVVAAGAGFTCGAWLVFATDALAGEPQWFTVPMGFTLLLAAGAGRWDRRHAGLAPRTPWLVAIEDLGIAFVVGPSLVESLSISPIRGLVAISAGVAIAGWGLTSRVRRRLFAGAGAVVAAVAIMLVGPVSRLVPQIRGPVLWLLLAAVGALLIGVATMLERGRAKLSSTIHQIDALMEGWE